MNLLFPVVERRLLWPMLGFTLAGGLYGGLYGTIHDLVTFTISPEYFTRLKFHQFSWANVGLSSSFFAAEVGFVATAAVGLAAGWFLARTALPRWSGRQAFQKMTAALTIVVGTGFLGGVTGWWLGLHHTADYSQWQSLCETLGVVDVPAFVRVAYIHNAGYLGGFAGLLLGIGWLKFCGRRLPEARGR